MEIERLYKDINFKRIINNISKYKGDSINIMEICGTHTEAIYKNGIDSILPENINLISGPGCPVCVTEVSYIDAAINLSNNKEIIIASFGDLLKLKGSEMSLLDKKSLVNNIKIIYSPLDVINLSKTNPKKEIVLLAVGFETTTATFACLLEELINLKLDNISLLTSLKTIPNTLTHLIKKENINIQGLIAPGHVASIIGIEKFNRISIENNIPSVVSGFKGEDILLSLNKLLYMIKSHQNITYNMYKLGVRNSGNIKAQKLIEKYFKECNGKFRGFGVINNAGLTLKEKYKKFDAREKFNLKIKEKQEDSLCICSEILKGKAKPKDCKLFGCICNPTNPVGACMVSNEGNCANYFKYKETNFL